MFFESWSGLWRVLVVGVLAYAALVVLLRVSGKRTLSKLNAFDFVVTVSLGSVLANVLLSKDVPLLEAVLAFAVLIFAQYAITRLSVRSPLFSRLVKSSPRLLVYRGRLLRDAMLEERVTEEEIRAVLRGHGVADLDAVSAVVLETDSSLNVLGLEEGQGQATLRSVRGFPPGDAP